MPKREDIIIKFGGDDKGFRKVAKRVHGVGSELSGAFRRFGADIASAFGVGAGIAGGGIVAAVAQMTQQLDDLGKTAEGLNTTVESLYALRYAVSQTSTATEQQLDTSLQKLIKHIGQAARGVKESQKLFVELGLSWEYLASLDTATAFIEVNEAIAAIDNSFTQASVAQKLYEDNWRRLLPTIRTSREEMEALTAQAQAMGGPTTEAAKAAADLNDSIGRLNKSMEGTALEYGPAVIDWVNGFIAVLSGTAGAVTAVDKLDESLNKLYDAQRRLNGEGSTLQNFLNLFLTDAERASALASVNEQIQVLVEERKQLTIQLQELKNASGQGPSSITAAEAASLKAGGSTKSGAGAAKKPELTYQQANLRDFQAYKSGEIDRAEYLKRENARNPYSNPDSPYAGDFSSPNYGSVDPQFTVNPVVNEAFVADVQRAVDAAMEGRTYTIKVKPELVGLEGVDVATIDTADKEGSHE